MVNGFTGKLSSSSVPLFVAVMLLAIASVITVPNYVSGKWAWTQSSQLTLMEGLRTLKTQGLELSGWRTIEQQTIELGHKKWSTQALVPDLEQGARPRLDPDLSAEDAGTLTDEPFFLYVRPQSDVKDKPLVEWLDFEGIQYRTDIEHWTTDHHHTIRFTVPEVRPPQVVSGVSSGAGPTLKGASITASAQYFRLWYRYNERYRTYAVVQWYAWPTGGSPKITSWFWADQWLQWRDRHHLPWVAVTALIPIEPLGEIEPVQPLAEAIAQTIQSTLTQQIFAPAAT